MSSIMMQTKIKNLVFMQRQMLLLHMIEHYQEWLLVEVLHPCTLQLSFMMLANDQQIINAS